MAQQATKMDTSKENGRSNKISRGISDMWRRSTWNIRGANGKKNKRKYVNEVMNEAGYTYYQFQKQKRKKKRKRKTRS